MKISLLTIVSVLLLLHEMKGDTSRVDQPSQPCQIRSKKSRYDEFVKKHILEECFNRNDKTQWSRYLVEKQLCGRTEVQSFINETKDQVSQVCRSSGQRVVNGGNLCISKLKMTFYVVKSHKENGNCVVDDVKEKKDKVVLACNKVENKCHPVHFEGKKQKASNQNCS